MPVGAPKGSRNAAKSRMFEQALIREIKQRDIKAGEGETLRKIAGQWVDQALIGDLQAMKELRDTLDGKPAQQVNVAGDQDNPLQHVIEMVVIDATDRSTP